MSSLIFRGLRQSALLLAATMIAVTGPGAAASTAATRGQDGPGPVAQTDPIAALAESLDYDPQKIFRYVADQIQYQPYPGILRGAGGTLAAQAGNSADKALLLGALLADSQVSYRFAEGALDGATTARIVDSFATDATTARTLAEEPLARGLDQIAGGNSPAAAASGPLAAVYDRQAATVLADGTKRLESAKSRLDGTVAMLSAALEGAGISLPASGEVSLPETETTNHVWVQMANGATWVDLDPTLQGTEPGAVLTATSQTLDQLPDDLRYPVEWDVLVERVSGGQLVTDTTLQYTGFADELAGVPVTFGHVTPSGMSALGVSLRNLFGDGWMEYRPALAVGNQSLIGDKAVAFPLGGTGSGILGAEPSPGASPGPVEGEATAEWLEVRVTPPGSAAEVARRTVFDRLPAEMRAAGELTPGAVEPIDLVDVTGTGTKDFPPMLGMRSFAVATGPTSAAQVAASSQDDFAMFALTYHDLRDTLDAELALDAGARTFVDGPNIVSISMDVDGNAESHQTRLGLDIWLRSHGILPLTGSSMSVAQSEVVAGVTDQIAERFAADGLPSSSTSPRPAIGVGDVFEAAAAQGIPNVVLRGSVPSSVPYGATATGLIRAAVAAGDVVIAPQKPVMIGDRERLAWWTIDPNTGATTDVMDDGSGPELGEYGVVVRTNLGRAFCFGALAAEAAADIAFVASLLSGNLSGSAVFRYWNGPNPYATRCVGF